MTSILAFVFVLGVLIFVHELGHFLVARRIGVRVLTFSLGFGPKLLKFTRGDTEYCISAIPLGGYVKMAGENPEDTRTGAPDEFLSKTKWQRFQVLVMGPVMNLVLAVVVMAVVLYQGAPVPRLRAAAGGDRHLRRGLGRPRRPGSRPATASSPSTASRSTTWEEFSNAIVPKAKRQRDARLRARRPRRPGLRRPRRAHGKYQLGDLGILPIVHPQIMAIITGAARRGSGPQGGDVILGADGELDISYEQLHRQDQVAPGQPLTLTSQARRRARRTRRHAAADRRQGDDRRARSASSRPSR